MYSALYAYLDNKRIKPTNIDRLDKAIQDDVDLADELFRLVWRELESLPNAPFVPGEFRCGIDHASLEKRESEDMDLVLRKLVSLSTTSFIYCGSIDRYSGDVHDGYSISWSKFSAFVQFVLRYRNVVEKNLIIPAPTYSFIESIGDFSNEKVVHADIGRDALKINLDIEEIERQFCEQSRPKHEVPAGTVDIFLPHLTNVSLETIIKLRCNEQDPFIRYHRYLSRFFRGLEKIDNERSIVECLQQIDQGIRETQASFEAIRKKNAYSSIGLAVGLSSAVLCLFMPHDIAEYIRAVIGGATGVAGFEYLASRQRSLSEIKTSDFYFPWLLHQKGKNLS